MGEERKIYYKVLDDGMHSTYHNFKYKLNKTYTINGRIEPCKNSFYACKNMYELVLWCNYHSIKECKFFKCHLGNTIIEYNHKVMSDSITLIEEIPFEVIDEEIKNNIDLLINNDRDWGARVAVAEQGYGLDRLINDKNPYIRAAVAEQGYGLDRLADDDEPNVREAVAEQGYGLDRLINDKDWHVREAVAEQGYGLDRLINDEYWQVRYAAKRKLEKRKRG